MRHYSFSIILFLTVTHFVQAQQTSSNEISLFQPDKKKLEQLTFIAVNKLREEKKLEHLYWDEVLFRAAQDHADFLIHEKKISHFQKTKGKGTPGERVKLHEGILYTAIGENIVQIQLGVPFAVKGKKLSTVTYESSAHIMAQLWKASPGHYKNILSSKFNCTALATSYDPATQRLIAVQVFAFTHTPAVSSELPDYADQLLHSPIPDLPYRLKEYRGQRPKNQKAVNKFLKLKMDRGYLTGSYRTAKKIFKGRRSGITQEYIPLSQFDSATQEFTRVPNRRNGLYELNGKLSKPVYRRALLRYSRKNTNRKYLIDTWLLKIKRRTTQFLYPLNPVEYETAFSLFLILQKQLQVHRSYAMVPSEFFDLPFPSLPYKNSFRPKDRKDQYKVTYQYDTIRLQIQYPSKVVTIDQPKQREVEDSFSRIRGKIVAVEGEAFASIEGEQTANDRLARERMQNFMSLLRPYLDTASVIPEIVTREQWTLFSKQIEAHNLTALKDITTEAARAYVNEHKKDSLLSELLDEQRYTRITLVWRTEHTEVIPGKSSLQEYNQLKQFVELIEKPKQKLIDQLEKAQLAVYYELARVDTTSKLPEVLVLERSPVFRYHELVFKYSIQHSISDNEFYNQLHQLAKLKYFPTHLKGEAHYNNLVLIYRSYANRKLMELIPNPQWQCRQYRQSEFHLKRFKKIKCKRGERAVFDDVDEDVFLNEMPALIKAGKDEKVKNFAEDDLWKYHCLYRIYLAYQWIPIDPELFTLLPKFKTYFHPNDAVLSDEGRLKFAYFYCAVQRYETALSLVKPLAVRDEPNKEALKLYLTLIYEDFKDQHEYSELLIREFSRLGKEEWCDLWSNPKYLNFLLLEDLKLKKFYNCNCDR